MALKKTLAQRLFNISKSWNQTCRLSTPSPAVKIPPPPPKLAPDPDDVISRRFLHRRSIYQSAAATEVAPPPIRSEKLLERLRGMDIARDRIRLDGLTPPAAASPHAAVPEKLTVDDARKVLRVSQLEMIKSKIRENKKDSVFLEEFIEICSDNCGSRELGLEFAKMLDESGHVIVLGKLVFLRPEQEVKPLKGYQVSDGGVRLLKTRSLD